MADIDKLNSLSTKDSKWIEEAKARQLKKARWGVLWKPRLRIIIKYYRIRRMAYRILNINQ